MTNYRVLAGVIIFCAALMLIGSGAAKNPTGAFVTDTETSESNIFTAGVWGGHQCDFILYSGTDDIVEETGNNATLVQTPYPAAWTASIPGATWIWNTSQVADPLLDQTFTFNRTFYWFGPIGTANLQIAADNLYWVYLNGNLIATSPNDHTYDNAQTIDLAGNIADGKNILEIKVENLPNTGSPEDTSAGLLYQLSINATGCAGP